MNEVENYLNAVQRELQDLSDREAIISELRAHIWDSAQVISRKEGVPIQEAFLKALQHLEEPKNLAKNFLEEDTLSMDNTSPFATSNIPELQIETWQLLVLAIIGIIGSIILSIAVIITNGTIGFLFPIVAIVAIGMFLAVLYLTDQRNVKEQVSKLRNKFIKQDSQIDFKIEFSVWAEHLSGLCSLIWLIVCFVGLLYILITNQYPLFNDNWYYLGMILTIGFFLITMLEAAFRMLIGRVKISRLVSAAVKMITASLIIGLIIIYPFQVAEVLDKLIVGYIDDPDVVRVMLDADLYVPMVMGICAIITYISAGFDVFKYSSWKPSDRRSLINKSLN